MWRRCAEVIFLEAEVTGSVSYTVYGCLSVQPLNSWTPEEVLSLGSPLGAISSPARAFVVRFQMEMASLGYSFSWILFRWVGGCNIVFVMLHVSTGPQSLRRCVSIDFYAVLL